MSHTVITIARQYGSGGKTVGKMLAEDLGIHFYDREIIRLASDESGISEQLFGAADEAPKSGILGRIAKKVYTGEVLPPDSDDFVSTDNLFNYQAKIIKQIAEEESCVIIGRCADFVLREHENVLSIFIQAPLADRVARISEKYLIEIPTEAKKEVLRNDKLRRSYYQFYTDSKWGGREHKDLVINSSVLGIDGTVDFIKDFIERKFK